ncbi:plasmid replication, integration and excision activator [Frankia sp. CNm7]|uniref:Plasmid replication, integration and excision activator n=1 Tax=Frankia nepalensis TaxID=1836974 RepID=A0A937URM9_9ACTN|nr:plasmid replication, integration and excision activator [Frankia nepalensis]MBL7498157.1 plasmid replication, integration and excision activator [Frankia nepalensis]MBL7509325.1 plasmid replication, integration and excision activator [Frankia nepalensis]MBL7516887.1 plasmid replication, integration and excision activator [Frankia nepalensis]MBL7627946.1 plasmid replication, integration and excision activator [Frankia nepalensis]
MAIPRRIPVAFVDVFPNGAYVLGVEPSNDFEKMRSGAPDPQELDKETGLRIWAVRVMDADPTARTAELKVKIAAQTAPVPPDPIPGTPFRPVELVGLQVIPWVDSNGARPKQMFALRASGLRPVSALPTRRGQAAA